MQRRIAALCVALLFLLAAGTVSAAGFQQPPGQIPAPITGGQLLGKPIQANPATPIAFNVISNRYTDVDPATTFDLNGDLTGDMLVSGSQVLAKNGAKVKLLDPPVMSLDDVQSVTDDGLAESAPVQQNRVYVMKLSTGYAKFMLLQTSPKVTIWFHYGVPTTGVLAADGATGKAVLTWTAMADAALGYNVYRYEIMDNWSYQVTLLNDFTVKELTYTDNTALRHNYLYVVAAIKADGSFGKTTTVAPCSIQSVQKTLTIDLSAGTAKLGATAITLEAPLVIKNGRLMVPASLLTSAGVVVTQDAAAGKVTLTRRIDNVTYTLVMSLDIPDYTWNGSAYKADVPPYKAGSVVMVPLRVVAPGLGFGLSFNSANRTATLQWYE